VQQRTHQGAAGGRHSGACRGGLCVAGSKYRHLETCVFTTCVFRVCFTAKPLTLNPCVCSLLQGVALDDMVYIMTRMATSPSLPPTTPLVHSPLPLLVSSFAPVRSS
jgi:hypothetical protein